MGTSYFLPRLVGVGVAVELMLSGRIFGADEAREVRLVSRVVEPEALEGSAVELARSIAENSGYGVWMTKKGLGSTIDAPSLRHATEMENRTQVLGSFTGAMEESMVAFSEGRKPRWKPL